MLAFWVVVFLLGMAALVKGADVLLDMAKKIGERLGLSSFAIGVVIVGFGTSLPELISSAVAQLSGASDIVAGNVMGSNITNILLIGGVSVVLARGLKLNLDDLEFDVGWLIASTFMLGWVLWDMLITPMEALMLLFILSLYMLAIFAFNADNQKHRPQHDRAHNITIKDYVLLGTGFALLLAGAYATVEAAVEIATILNVATGVIALLAIALGTSLPELMVTIKAAMKGSADIAIGNIFGSNVFNVFAVLGLPGLLGAMTVEPATAWSFGFLLAGTALLSYAGYRRYFSFGLGIAALFSYALFVLFVSGIVG